ncbi:MAG: LptA/OstA family protein [Limnochordia bacterium]
MNKILAVILILCLSPLAAAAGELHIQVEGVGEDTPWGHFDLAGKVYIIDPEVGRVVIEYRDFTIGGQRVEYREGDAQALIEGDVTLQQGDLEVKSGELTAYLREDRFIFTGAVSLRTEDYQLQAQRVEYWQEEEKLEATGDVTISFEEGSIHGQHFTLWREGEKLAGYGPGKAHLKVE